MNFNFVKQRKKYFLASGIVILIGIVFLSLFGLNLGVDFASGTRLDLYTGEPVPQQEVLAILQQHGAEPERVQSAGENGDTLIAYYSHFVPNESIGKIREELKATYGEAADLQQSSVDPAIAKATAQKAVWGILLASLGIVVYVMFRFEYRFALSAIVALLHDVFIVVAFFSIFRLEVDLTFIAAVLTVVGYSINDTIVIFDRIRENLRQHKVKRFSDLEEVVNLSIRQTLVRSINTVLTVLFAALALFVFVGGSMRNFALALLIGIASGAFSSIFIASQVWVSWRGHSLRREKEAV